MARIDIALSGGVDSAVAGVRLLEAGHDVRGVTMLLDASVDRETVEAARDVAAALGIPHRTVDLRAEFERLVVGPFAQAYADGLTPNPCVVCNETVKLGALLESAIEDGADRLATGHYARVHVGGDRVTLHRGRDRGKDQSYFLYRLRTQTLSRVDFPLGALLKDEVREIADRAKLPCSERRESQDACFVSDTGYVDVLRERHPEALTPGPTVDQWGERIGTHQGIGTVTIGQRRGLGVSAPEPMYVVDIEKPGNRIVAGGRDALSTTDLRATDVVWNAEEPVGECVFMFRHGGTEVAGSYQVDGTTLRVTASEPVWGVAPGQSLVCYKGDAVLGGGVLVGSGDREGPA